MLTFKLMKRSISICLMLLYVMLSTGVALNIHYCAGKISSITINYKSDPNCGCGGESKSNCCKDKQAYVKVKDSHQYPADVKVKPIISANFLLSNVLDKSENTDIAEVITQATHSPPKYLKKELHLFIRVLLV